MPEIIPIMTLCINREAIRQILQVQYFQNGRNFWQAPVAMDLLHCKRIDMLLH